jgi:hypothetical protein
MQFPAEGRVSRVATIAGLIHEGADSGQSIAITGSWGGGKSSVLVEILREQLEAQTDRDLHPGLRHRPECLLRVHQAHGRETV